MKKIAIIVGHNVYGKKKGAKNYLGVHESTYNFGIAKDLRSQLKAASYNAKIFLRDGSCIKEVGENVAEFNPELSLELHFNAFRKPAFGCEVLALNLDIKSIKFAQLLAKNISHNLNTKLRHQDGVYEISKGGRGFWNLNHIRQNAKKDFPTVLVEPCFANIKTTESRLFFEKPHVYVLCLYNTINEFFSSNEQELNENTNRSPRGIFEVVKNKLREVYQ